MRSNRLMSSLCAVLLLAFSQSAMAKSKPKDATAQCKDGTYSTAKTQQGACSKHGGVQTWYGEENSTTKVVTKSTTQTTSRNTTSVPKGATAQCKDGTYSTAKTKQGACAKHGGVQTWMADKSTATSPPAAPSGNAPQTTETHGRETTTTQSSTVARGAGTPATATAKCKDGAFSYAKQHSGACSHHGGVAEWYR